MSGFSVIAITILVVFLVLPAFLPLLIKKPAGPNRYGLKPAPQSFGGAIGVCLRKFFNGNGRATRSEYWWFYLFTVLVSFGLGIVAAVTGIDSVDAASSVFLIPSVTAGIRRLHDINRSGWWMLIGFGLGALVLLWWYIQPSQAGQEEGVAQVFE